MFSEFVAMSHSKSRIDQWPPCSADFENFYIAVMKQGMSRIAVTNLKLVINTLAVDLNVIHGNVPLGIVYFLFEHRVCLTHGNCRH